jgi:hypothetical protein
LLALLGLGCGRASAYLLRFVLPLSCVCSASTRAHFFWLRCLRLFLLPGLYVCKEVNGKEYLQQDFNIRCHDDRCGPYIACRSVFLSVTHSGSLVTSCSGALRGTPLTDVPGSASRCRWNTYAFINILPIVFYAVCLLHSLSRLA